MIYSLETPCTCSSNEACVHYSACTWPCIKKALSNILRQSVPNVSKLESLWVIITPWKSGKTTYPIALMMSPRKPTGKLCICLSGIICSTGFMNLSNCITTKKLRRQCFIQISARTGYNKNLIVLGWVCFTGQKFSISAAFICQSHETDTAIHYQPYPFLTLQHLKHS